MKERTGDMMDTLEYEVASLSEYYRDKGLTIIGLNDSQGVNTTSLLFKKGLLEYISSALKDKNLNPLILNAFSLTMNKTEHINYFLENNLSLEEIKLSQIYSAVSAFEKVMGDVHLPEFLGSIANVYRLAYPIKKGDEKIFITDSLRNFNEPTVIYSSGVNNLMREVGNNPFQIKNDYKNRWKKPNYNYTLEKSKDPKTVKTVMLGIKENFENILTINDKADIYTLGAYIPASLKLEGMNIFRDMVIEYNAQLEELCAKYNITYINTEAIGKKYNKSSLNFHVNRIGHNELANYILHCMYERKIENRISNLVSFNKSFIITNEGSKSIIDAIHEDYDDSILKAEHELDSYSIEREHAIAKEHEREFKVFNKVLNKTITPHYRNYVELSTYPKNNMN